MGKGKKHVGIEFFSLVVADIISCVEFNHDGELLATGDKAGRVVIFQRDQTVSYFRYYIIFRDQQQGKYKFVSEKVV